MNSQRAATANLRRSGGPPRSKTEVRDGLEGRRDTPASRFLEAAQPDVYVKGGDYTLDTLNQEERQLVEKGGGRIVIIPLVPGKSTTELLGRLRSR